MRSSWKVNTSFVNLKNLIVRNNVFEYKNKALNLRSIDPFFCVSRSLKFSCGLVHSGLTVFIHDGRFWIPFKFQGLGASHASGEFVFTKSYGRRIHIDKKKKKKK